MPLMSTHSRNILVVDDEDLLRKTLSRLLTHLGHTVAEARHGQEAIELLEHAEAPFHITLLDLNMPGLDSTEVVPALKALDPSCRIILTSGRYDMDLVGRLKGLGAFTFLAKPFGLEDLAKAIQDCE